MFFNEKFDFTEAAFTQQERYTCS